MPQPAALLGGAVMAVGRGRWGASTAGLRGSTGGARPARHGRYASVRATLMEPLEVSARTERRNGKSGGPLPPAQELPRVHKRRLNSPESVDKRLFLLAGKGAVCNVWSDGAISIFRLTPTGPVLASRAKAAIPWFVARGQCVCDETVPGQLTLRWGEDAVLRLTTTESAPSSAWAQARARPGSPNAPRAAPSQLGHHLVSFKHVRPSRSTPRAGLEQRFSRRAFRVAASASSAHAAVR